MTATSGPRSAILPPAYGKRWRPVIRVREIVEAVASVELGGTIYHCESGATCIRCHSLRVAEEIVGPGLSAMVSKDGKEGWLDAILDPSAGIVPGYASWILDISTQGRRTNSLIEDKSDRVVVRTEAADETSHAAQDTPRGRGEGYPSCTKSWSAP